MKKIFTLELILALVAVIILGFPLFMFGIDRSFFYNIDPDVVYVTNALLYTKYAIITYMDHPGTPAIMLLYYIFFPLRFITKFILHQGFIQWSFDNFAILFYYIRVFQLFLTGFTLWLFLGLIRMISNSKLITVLVFFLVFLFSASTFAIVIAPEIYSFFLTVVWLVIFNKFIKTNNYYLSAVLAFISGMTFANKFTSAFLVIVSIFLPLFIRRTKMGQKLIMVEANIAVALQAFIFGIWPIMDHLMGIFDWGKSLFSHAGTHGTGTTAIFDWTSYFVSVITLVKENPALFIFILITISLGVCLVIKRKLKLIDPLIFMLFVSSVGIAVFAKYPITHYSYVNILLIIFCASHFMSKINKVWIKIFIPVLLLLSLNYANSYVSAATRKLQGKPVNSVYEILEKWTPYWSADIFREQFNAKLIKP